MNSRTFCRFCVLAVPVLIAAILSSSLAAGAANAGSTDIVTYELTNYGTQEHAVAVTFGSIFARGDVPQGASLDADDRDGKPVPLQLDRKATHPDHSLRHAVVTLVVPDFPPGSSMPVTLRRNTSGEATIPPVTPTDLPSDFDAVLTLTSKEQRLVASARDLLARTKPETWLAGPYVSEWWVAGPLKDDRGVADPHLYVQFGIRCYGKDRPLRIEVNVENDWTWVSHPRTEFYDVQIALGAKVVFAKAGLIQPAHTRWRKGFWWDQPVAVYLKQNLAYLKKARIIPNYDPDLVISQAALAKTYKTFEASDREPMAAGIVTKYMPTTGGRTDIAPLPQWQALYLLTMDPRMYEVTLQSADLGGSFSAHYRNEKTGRPATLEDYPKISTHSNYLGRPGQLELPDTGGYVNPLSPDAAHEPTLDFVPYLVTGDRFYLEELESWSQWNAMGTAPENHGLGQGLIVWDQERAQAWSLRTLAQAEFIAPDTDPLKPVLKRELQANINWYDEHFLRGPDSNSLGLLWRRESPSPYSGGRSIAPWQDDFFTWALGYVQSLGDMDALPFFRWKAKFPVGRMVDPGFCWISAPAYELIVRDAGQTGFYTTFGQVYRETLSERLKKLGGGDSGSLKCAGEDMAKALRLRPGEMVENAVGTDGYSAFLQPALAAAVDWDQPGAEAAWQLLASRPVKPDYSTEPGWDIVPRTKGP